MFKLIRRYEQMSESKFTKGEWTVEDGRVVACGDFRIAYSYSGSNIPYTEPAKANAHLIAAAPEMYEAMQEFVNRVDKGEVRSNKTYNKFKSILAKARGEKC